jgi:hypothetical protein
MGMQEPMRLLSFNPFTNHQAPVTAFPMSEDRRRILGEDTCVHIFTVSAAMVGVCLTVIGLLRVVVSIRKADTIADDLLAGDAVIFLTSCLLAYWALRTRSVGRMHRVERFADAIFILALLLMVGVCCFITFAIAVQ